MQYCLRQSSVTSTVSRGDWTNPGERNDGLNKSSCEETEVLDEERRNRPGGRVAGAGQGSCALHLPKQVPLELTTFESDA
jgi:hypothetical protein